MILWKKIQSALMTAVIVPVVICSLPAQTIQGKIVWGAAVNGLEMSLSVDPATVVPLHTPALMLHLRNVRSTPLMVTLNKADCDLQEPFTSKVAIVISNSSGGSARWIFAAPAPPPAECAGAAMAPVQPLSPGEVVSTPLQIENYRSWAPPYDVPHPLNQEWLPGRIYFLQTELENSTAVPPRGNNWAGTIKSNKLEIHFPAK
jgi:hypothetical protein